MGEGLGAVVADTSPLVFLGKIDRLPLLGTLFDEVQLPEAVEVELREGAERGHFAVTLGDIPGLLRVRDREPLPAWLAFDLGPGELAVLAVAASDEEPRPVVLLDDGLARRVAQAAGLRVWGTLRVLLEAKKRGHVAKVAPLMDRLAASGMYLSDTLRQGVLRLAGEAA